MVSWPLVVFILALGLDPPGGVFLLGVPGGVVGIGLGSIDLLPSLPFLSIYIYAY